MSSIKKLAVLSMLAVVVLAFNLPASAAIGAGIGTSAIGAGVGTGLGTSTSIASSSAVSTASAAGIGAGGFGAFGGFGFPFNWGFSSLGIGAFPFNWGLGAGLGTFGLGWNQFSPGFGTGSFFSPGFLGGSCFQGLPFIMGSPGGCVGPGFGVTPWAFGLGATMRSAPLFFGAHGFGFPFSLGGISTSFIPAVV